jgi:hypothetical protein
MSRVKDAIRKNPRRAPAVLGHVLAHEIGHVLQGVARHSDSGLMKGRWSLGEMRDIMRGVLFEFAPYDSELIQVALGANRTHPAQPYEDTSPADAAKGEADLGRSFRPLRITVATLRR